MLFLSTASSTPQKGGARSSSMSTPIKGSQCGLLNRSTVSDQPALAHHLTISDTFLLLDQPQRLRFLQNTFPSRKLAADLRSVPTRLL